jgi:hypothetical protein
MSTKSQQEPPQLDVKRLAQLAQQFLDTVYGGWSIAKLSAIYNNLHHEAEEAQSIDEKALKVERAAGLRLAIDLLTHDAALLETGYFDNDKDLAPEE